MFVALPSTSAAHADVGVILPLKPGEKASEPFNLNANFLDAQSTDTRVFTRSTEAEFWNLWGRLELGAGHQRMVQRFFSSMTRSAYFYRENEDSDWFRLIVGRLVNHVPAKVVDRRAVAEAYARQIVKSRRERAIAFQSRLASYSFRQVCDGKAIEQWLETGRRPDTAHSDSNRSPDSREERIMRVNGVLELMDRNKNFHLAITDRFDDQWRVGPATRKDGPDVAWIINENDVFAIERQEYGRPEFGETRIVLEQEEVCRSFIDHFDNGWDELRPEERDQRSVMDRMRAWVSRLEGLEPPAAPRRARL
jgi:hypothetical protein